MSGSPSRSLWTKVVDELIAEAAYPPHAKITNLFTRWRGYARGKISQIGATGPQQNSTDVLTAILRAGSHHLLAAGPSASTILRPKSAARWATKSTSRSGPLPHLLRRWGRPTSPHGRSDRKRQVELLTRASILSEILGPPLHVAVMSHSTRRLLKTFPCFFMFTPNHTEDIFLEVAPHPPRPLRIVCNRASGRNGSVHIRNTNYQAGSVVPLQLQ